MVLVSAHTRDNIPSTEAILPSMEATTRWALVTAVAPIAWGSTYYVTHRFLPADQPLWGSALRALPAGLLLLAVRRERPRGDWWWRAAVLGTLNMGAFFALVYVSAQLLPTSLAATIMAVSPAAMMAVAWLALAERPRALAVTGAAVGIGGVVLMLATGVGAVSPLGVVASAAAMLMSATGHVLTKKWASDADVLSVTSWQLIAGGLVLTVAAVVIEGGPPPLTASSAAAFGYVTVIATAVAFSAWFTGLRHLDAGTVGLIGLLNPVTGVVLGMAVAGEPLTARQGFGLALVLVGVLLGQPAARRLSRARQPRPDLHV
ncbi:putative membrane protein [Saccharothrix espanaensis DSM 44229]|uniref:Putative membrane protein n=2 Tax=Saccharothrix espanaensis TaxID=103731 RepID=K0K2P6_SACES|nr:putative membrane protein [Saccharothrix espanaensis DSM 44229]